MSSEKYHGYISEPLIRMARELFVEEFPERDFAGRMEAATEKVAADEAHFQEHVTALGSRITYKREQLLGLFKKLLSEIFATDMNGNRYSAFDLDKSEVIPVAYTENCIRDFTFKWHWTPAGIAGFRPVNGAHPILDTIISSVIHQSCV